MYALIMMFHCKYSAMLKQLLWLGEDLRRSAAQTMQRGD